MENPFDWAEQKSAANVTVEELDGMIKDYREKREIYEKAKRESADRYRDYQEVEGKITEALKALGKKSYKVDGLGTFTRVMKEVVKVPKDIGQKRELFAWIESKYGKDVLDDMVSINHQSLNSFYRQEAEKEKENPVFEIPGIESPTSVENVSFRKG